MQIMLSLSFLQSLSWTIEGFSMTRLKRAERDRESSDQLDVGKVSNTTISFQVVTHSLEEQCFHTTSNYNVAMGQDPKEARLFSVLRVDCYQG